MPTSSEDPSTAKSLSGYVILYAGFPIVWDSKLQTIIDLSSTEAEYVLLSQSLQDLIPIMVLVKEMKKIGFEVFLEEPILHCKGF